MSLVCTQSSEPSANGGLDQNRSTRLPGADERDLASLCRAGLAHTFGAILGMTVTPDERREELRATYRWRAGRPSDGVVPN